MSEQWNEIYSEEHEERHIRVELFDDGEVRTIKVEQHEDYEDCCFKLISTHKDDEKCDSIILPADRGQKVEDECVGLGDLNNLIQEFEFNPETQTTVIEQVLSKLKKTNITNS